MRNVILTKQYGLVRLTKSVVNFISLNLLAPRMVLLIFEEGDAVNVPFQTATGTIVWDSGNPDPTNRSGASGTHNGVAGDFSADLHPTAPRLFKPHDTYAPTDYTAAFAITDATTSKSLADDPANWSVAVNGSNTVVSNVYRKSVPIKTVEIVDSAYSRRRHLVTLLMPADLTAGSTISVTPPSGAAITGKLRQSAVSEAIHVCLSGYPLAGPKAAYVGLWLGHDRNGVKGNTNSVLSTTTPWSLINAAGQVVVSGTLGAAAKAEASIHADSNNFNGCDIYECRFNGVNVAGSYRISVDGIGVSPLFGITADPYAEVTRLAARWFYHQRSGCAIEAPYGEGRTRPRNGHPADGFKIYQTNVPLGRYSEGFTGTNVVPVLQAIEIWDEDSPNFVPNGTNLQASDFSTLGGTSNVVNGVLTMSGGFASAQINLIQPLVSSKTYNVSVTVTQVTGTTVGKIEVQGGASGSHEIVSDPTLSSGPGVYTTTLTGANSTRVRFVVNGGGDAYKISSISIRDASAPAKTPTNDNAWGGWHDAGDWDRRVQHVAFPVYVMAQAIELLPTARTLHMNIPESGKTFADAAVLAKKDVNDTGDGVTVLPDLIHEALWGISLWRRTQGEDGSIIGGVEYTRSGVHGSVSWNPIQRHYAYGSEEWSAYNFVMGAAKLGYVIKNVVGDAVLGQKLIDEAAAAWTWAESKLGTLSTTLSAQVDAAATTATLNAVDVVVNDWLSIRLNSGSYWTGRVTSIAGNVVTLSTAAASTASIGNNVYKGTDQYNFHHEKQIAEVRIPAAGTLFRSNGNTTAKAVFEAYNAFLPTANALPDSGSSLQTVKGDYYFEALDYARAVGANTTIANDIISSSSNKFGGSTRLGADYGLHNTSLYPWGTGWLRFGPGSNWRSSHVAMQTVANNGVWPADGEAAVLEGMWFGLGCNPSNVSFIQGIGSRVFGDALLNDIIDAQPIPGQISFGVMAGSLRSFELEDMGDTIYPKSQSAWPRYTAIWESHRCIFCAEHGMRGNVGEWILATLMAREAISRLSA